MPTSASQRPAKRGAGTTASAPLSTRSRGPAIVTAGSLCSWQSGAAAYDRQCAVARAWPLQSRLCDLCLGRVHLGRASPSTTPAPVITQTSHGVGWSAWCAMNLCSLLFRMDFRPSPVQIRSLFHPHNSTLFPIWTLCTAPSRRRHLRLSSWSSARMQYILPFMHKLNRRWQGSRWPCSRIVCLVLAPGCHRAAVQPSDGGWLRVSVAPAHSLYAKPRN